MVEYRVPNDDDDNKTRDDLKTDHDKTKTTSNTKEGQRREKTGSRNLAKTNGEQREERAAKTRQPSSVRVALVRNKAGTKAVCDRPAPSWRGTETGKSERNSDSNLTGR